jgi:hypothetical protein
MSEDIRWKQRFDNYCRAFETLRRGVELASQRELSELEQQGLVQGFEFTHELAWNVLKDYLKTMTFQASPALRGQRVRLSGMV